MRRLRINQRQAIGYINKNKRFALFMEMRLGKTLCVIRALRHLKRVLIIAPYCAIPGWVSELENENESNVLHLIGSAKERKKTFERSDTKWTLTNKEIHLTYPRIAEFPWDAIILDESTFIKNPKAKITKYFCKNFRYVKIRGILTGTPNPESSLDYFQQLKFLNIRWLGYDNYWQYRATNYLPFGFKWNIKREHNMYLRKILADNCLIQKRKQYNLGGEIIRQVRAVEFTPQQKKIYKQICDEFILEVGSIERKTIHVIVAVIWMRQLCGGFINDFRPLFLSDNKAKQIISDLKGELLNQQVVIYCNYIPELRHLQGLLIKANVSCEIVYGKIKISARGKLHENFRRKRFRVLIAQPETIKHGVNLSCASTIIWYSTTISAETREQATNRTIDIEKNNSCLVLDYVIKDTVDEDALKSVLNKETKSEFMTRAVQRIQSIKKRIKF